MYLECAIGEFMLNRIGQFLFYEEGIRKESLKHFRPRNSLYAPHRKIEIF